MPTVSRRLLLAAAATTVIPGRLAFANELTMTPEQTEGPFYPRILPVDSDNDLVQVRGSPARAMGTVLHLQGRVLDAAGNRLATMLAVPAHPILGNLDVSAAMQPFKATVAS